MMDDLISRAAAIAEIEEYIEEYSELEPETGYHNLKWCAMEEAKDVLSMLPAVDAVPVVWVAINGFEGLYEISNFGRVRNRNGAVLKQRIKRTNCTCYKTVDLWKDGRYYKKYIHRLMADAFIPNPNNLPFVNHKDEDGTNNFIDNLEWCTREYNVNYGTAKERRAKKIRGVPHTEEHKKKISSGLRKYYSTHEVWNKGKMPNCGARMDGERRDDDAADTR